MTFDFRVCALNDVDELARVSCCVPQYIRKGIAIASFILGRCYERGLGVKQDSKQGIAMYKKVNDLSRSIFPKTSELFELVLSI